MKLAAVPQDGAVIVGGFYGSIGWFFGCGVRTPCELGDGCVSGRLARRRCGHICQDDLGSSMHLNDTIEGFWKKVDASFSLKILTMVATDDV